MKFYIFLFVNEILNFILKVELFRFKSYEILLEIGYC